MISDQQSRRTRFQVPSHAPRHDPRQAYVWTWLGERIDPVVAGVITRHEDRYLFTYAKSYLARKDAVPLYEPELPLRPGAIVPQSVMAGALRDASPDGWGRRVIASSLLGQQGDEIRTDAIDELTYLLESGSNRIGALDLDAPG